MNRILAIDLGHTVGLVVLEVVPGEVPLLLDASELSQDSLVGTFERHSVVLASWLFEVKPTIVVVEDYVVYATHATRHIGNQLFTAKLVGAIQALCATVIPPIPVALLPAAKKGRWPDARLKAKFPDGEVFPLDAIRVLSQSEHVLDALKLGLVYIEEAGLWKPSESKSE